MGENRGRPTLYTPEVAREILARICDGESVASICRDEHIPAMGTVLGWVVDDRDGFSNRYARALDVRAHGWAEETVGIADDRTRDLVEGPDGKVRVDHENINRARLRVDTRKWFAARLLRKRYGDKVEVSHSINPHDYAKAVKDFEAEADEADGDANE